MAAALKRFNVPLPEFLRGYARHPFEPGHHDCVLMACDWVLERRGVDPAAPWRGLYKSRASAARLIRNAGGLVPLVTGGMALANMATTEDAMFGDVAVIRFEQTETMAIRTVTGWATHCPSGIAFVSAEPCAVWFV